MLLTFNSLAYFRSRLVIILLEIFNLLAISENEYPLTNTNSTICLSNGSARLRILSRISLHSSLQSIVVYCYTA